MVRYFCRQTDRQIVNHTVHLLYGVPTDQGFCGQQKQKTLTTYGICALPLVFLIGISTIHSQLETDMMMRHVVRQQGKKETEQQKSCFFFFFSVRLSLAACLSQAHTIQYIQLEQSLLHFSNHK